jgi:glycine cleavage system aminomethyltransferase T
MKALGAVFGSVFGWERPNWFAPEGYELSEADLDKPETLLNHNHPDVPGDRSAKSGRSAAPTTSSMLATNAAM